MTTLAKAFRSAGHRELLPRSIRGVWRSDLFVGSTVADQWVATTLKTNAVGLEADAGIRIGIYPERRAGELPTWDESKNLSLCPLPYNAAFVELFYATFFIVKAVFAEDARVPPPWQLPGSEDRYVAQELVVRRGFTVAEIIAAFGTLAQPDLLQEAFAGDVADEMTDAVAPVPAADR